MTAHAEGLVRTSVPPPEHYVGHLLRRAQQLHLAAWLREVATDITSVQFAALSVLARTPGLSQAALGAALDLDRSTIADLTRRMAARELLTRVRSADDNRRNVLELTGCGLAVLAELQPRVEGLEPVLTAGLSAQEAAELRRLLHTLLARAGEQGLLASIPVHQP